jgi:hypothetical protein
MEFFATFEVKDYLQTTSCSIYFESLKTINNTFTNFDK